MTDPSPRSNRGPDPVAKHAPRAGSASESTQRDPSDPPAPDQGAGRYAHPEAQLGGADAVEKTTYVVGEGTGPAGRPSGRYVARGAGSGHALGWIVGAIAALIALVYAIGVFM